MATWTASSFTWRKSSYSTDTSNCVEVGTAHSAVGVRDTKDPGGGTLVLTSLAWQAFLSSTR